MSKIVTLMKSSAQNRSGSASIEFALVIALIALAVMAGVTASGDKLRTNYSNIGSAFDQPSTELGQR